MRGKTILITGGAGFLGSNLAQYLVSRGNKVTVYDNLSRQGSEIILKRMLEKFPQIEFVRGDLADIGHFLGKRKFDLVYHFAAQVAVTHSYADPHNDFRINAVGTFNVVYSTDVPVIYASTNKVFGDNVNRISLEENGKRYDFAGDFKGKGISENFSIDTPYHTPYGVSKLVGEHYVRERGGIANRFSCMYGPGQFGNEDQGWVAHFVLSKVKNKPVVIYGDGKQVRDLLFVEDAVRLLELQGENADKLKGEVFTIGGGYRNTMSLLELNAMLGLEYSFRDWRPADQKVYYSDNSKAKTMLGWEPCVRPEEGIAKLREWAKSI